MKQCIDEDEICVTQWKEPYNTSKAWARWEWNFPKERILQRRKNLPIDVHRSCLHSKAIDKRNPRHFLVGKKLLPFHGGLVLCFDVCWSGQLMWWTRHVVRSGGFCCVISQVVFQTKTGDKTGPSTSSRDCLPASGSNDSEAKLSFWCVALPVAVYYYVLQNSILVPPCSTKVLLQHCFVVQSTTPDFFVRFNLC